MKRGTKMPKLSSNQLFVLTIVALAILAGVAYLDRTYLTVVVSAVLAILAAGGVQHASATGAAHVVAGVNLAVPLSPTPPLPLPLMEHIPPLDSTTTPAAASPVAASADA